MASVAIASVSIPEGRWREANVERVQKMRESFQRFGQLQPIIIDKDNTLVDGLHRITAAIQNGMQEIDAIFRDEADPIVLREIELEVNIQRQDMTWQEQQRAIAELHKMRVARDPSWGATQTQHLAGLARHADVGEALKLTKMMELFPELEKAKSKHQALRWAETKARHILRVEDMKHNVVDYSAIESKLLLGDSTELIKSVPSESFHAIITDPPFGIDYDERTQGQEGSLTAYEDDADSYTRILGMAPDFCRVLKPDGWLIFFLGITWYERAKQAMREAGFLVDEIPIVWDRTEGRTFTSRPDRYFTRGYDIALHCLKGNPGMAVRGRSNVLHFPPVSQNDKEFLVERPVELYAELITRLTVPGETVADFFVGSGSCLAAAAKLRRDFFGCELDPQRRAGAIAKIHANLPEKK